MPNPAQGTRIRLRTLILLRWLAIAGQLTAIATAALQFDLQLELWSCLGVVAAAVAVNLAAMLLFPESTRLPQSALTGMLLFDSAQLAGLLFLTGGLHNPFALLLVVPVAIAATALRPGPTLVIGLLTIAIATFLAFFHMPLRLDSGAPIAMPGLLAFGFWLALVIGVIFLGLYAWRVAGEIRTMGEALLATQLALAREQKLAALGGLAAAAAHEFGTPLATIKLASAELADELAAHPALKADALLIREQAERCGDILRGLGRDQDGAAQLVAAPLAEIIREAAEPHMRRGKSVEIILDPAAGVPPNLHRRPEIIHGLRNLIQNAVDFARSAVWVRASWDETDLRLRIADNGPGYPAHLLGRIGDPFMRQKRPADGRRAYDGLGLGLFIAKTLLERTGARLRFANGADPFLAEHERPPECGAIVEVSWPRAQIEAAGPFAVGEAGDGDGLR